MRVFFILQIFSIRNFSTIIGILGVKSLHARCELLPLAEDIVALDKAG